MITENVWTAGKGARVVDVESLYDFSVWNSEDTMIQFNNQRIHTKPV